MRYLGLNFYAVLLATAIVFSLVAPIGSTRLEGHAFAQSPVAIGEKNAYHFVTDYFQKTNDDIDLKAGSWNFNSLSSSNPTKIQGNGTVYFVHSSIIVEKGANLNITGIKLLLSSSEIGTNALPVRIIVQGRAELRNSSILSWSDQEKSPDPNPFHPRPFVLAIAGGSLNVTNSNVSHMGFALSDISSIAALNYFDTKNYVIKDSTLSQNYYGFYSQNVTNFRIEHNEVYNNTGYGLDPHTYSTNFTIIGNDVRSNGKQGIICSFHCSNFTITSNVVVNNTEGIGIHWFSNYGTVSNNTVQSNRQYGIFILNSSRGNQITNNHVVANGYGIGVLLNSTGNSVLSNTLINNRQNTVFADKTSAANTIQGNNLSTDNTKVQPPSQIQPASFQAISFADASNMLEFRYPASWIKSNQSSDQSNGTLLNLTIPDASGSSQSSTFSVRSVPLLANASIINVADYTVGVEQTRLSNLQVVSDVPSNIHGKVSITVNLAGIDSERGFMKKSYFSVMDGNKAILFQVASSPQNFDKVFSIAEGILNSVNLEWNGTISETFGRSPQLSNATVPVINSTSYSYLYGCTFYTPTSNHCDPILNSYQSNSVDTSLTKVMPVPSRPAFVQSKYKSALDMKASSLDLVRINNAPQYNNTNFTVYLSVRPTNPENILGALVSFRPQERNSGWELDTLPSNSTDTAVLRFSLFNTQGDAQSPGDIRVPSSKFSDIVASFDGKTIKLYVDGVLKATSEFNGDFRASPTMPNSLSVGSGSYCSCSTVTASYDELRLYNRTLSDQEVSLINSGHESSDNPNPFVLGGVLSQQPIVPGLVGQWKFDGDLSDSTSHHNDGSYWTLTASMTTTPDGRVLFTEKNSGIIGVIGPDGNLAPRPFATISPIYVSWEEGLLGLTLDNKYSENRFVYVYYNYQDPDTGSVYSRVVRLTDSNGTGINMQIIYDKIPASNGFHTGGAIRFNPADDKLYVFVGDGTQRQKAQDLSTLNGKLLRLNRDGTIPTDNPFPGSPIYSYGHRNAFGLAFDPSGNGLLAEAREDLYDQVDFLKAGGNYGWPTMTPPNLPPELFTNNSSIKPIRSYYTTPSPTETIFYTGDKYPELKNSFIFGTVRGDLYSLKLSNSTHALSSELKLLLHLYPFEPIVTVTQLPSGEIMIGGYNIYLLKGLAVEKEKPLMYPVAINSTNIPVRGLSYDPGSKLITIDFAGTPGNNSVIVSFPTNMLSSGIKDVQYNANSTLAIDGNTTVQMPYSEETLQNGTQQIVYLNFPGAYSDSDHVQILIDGSGASITKNVPEFSQIALIGSLGAGLALIVLLRRIVRNLAGTLHD